MFFSVTVLFKRCLQCLIQTVGKLQTAAGRRRTCRDREDIIEYITLIYNGDEHMKMQTNVTNVITFNGNDNLNLRENDYFLTLFSLIDVFY